MQYLIFDAIIVVLLALSVWRGYRTGFILTFCGFLAIFVALIGATVVSNVLAQPVSKAISPMIESSIQHSVSEKLQSPDLSVEDSSQVQLPAGSDSSQESPVPDLPLEELLTLMKAVSYTHLVAGAHNVVDLVDDQDDVAQFPDLLT